MAATGVVHSRREWFFRGLLVAGWLGGMRRSRALAALILPLTACTVDLSPGSAAPTGTPATTVPPVTTTPSPGPNQNAPTPAATSMETLPTLAPVARSEAVVGETRTAVEVFPVNREPKATLVTVRVSVLDGNGTLAHLAAGPLHRTVAGQVRVVDHAAGQILIPSLVDGDPACSPRLPTSVRSGDVIWSSCVFGPLSPAATKVSVQVGGYGGFDDVPVR
ncbi:hypothetical protein GCM10027418_12060 [Mariniluteicoccus endophyticus]